MLEDAALASLGERGASVADVESVCRGSNWYCKNCAYATEVRAHLQRLVDDGETKVVAVNLSELYLKRPGAVAGHQASQAGWSLAKVLGD
jgi:hypothetical protein